MAGGCVDGKHRVLVIVKITRNQIHYESIKLRASISARTQDISCILCRNTLVLSSLA